MNEINIQTITPKYDVIEDRVRLMINHKDENSRIDFMMTRNFVLQLLPSYEEYLHKVYTKLMQDDTPTQGKQTKGARIPNHTTLAPYQEKAELILNIQFSFIDKNEITVVKFKTKQSQAIVRLEYEALKSMFRLIKSTIPYYDWGISPHI